MADHEEGNALYETPSLYIAALIAIYIIASLALERVFRWVKNWLRNNERTYLIAALHTLAKEIGILGLMSLLLNATSTVMPKMCIPTKITNAIKSFSMCPSIGVEEISRGHHCKEKFESLVSSDTMEQLHLFTFLLPAVQVLYTTVTLYLTTLKIRRWREWENEIQLQVTNNMHMNKIFLWMVCLFRSFSRSVVRNDYLRHRQIFIMKYDLPSTYDFHGHILRSLNEDFPRIVNINPILWMCAVILMVFNIVRFRLYVWIPLTSIMLLLLIGTKFQHVLIVLTSERAADRPQNEQFWFNKPKLLFFLIHFILFQSVFELTYLLWILWHFNNGDCILLKEVTTSLALFLAFATLVLCSCNILPLYVLVSQRQGEQVELTQIAVVHNMSESSGTSYLLEETSGATSFRSCSENLEREVGTKYKREDNSDEAPPSKRMKF